jgi:hypothetical protein
MLTVVVVFGVVLLASGVAMWVRERSRRRAAVPPDRVVLGASERWHDGWLGAKGTRRPVAVRCAFGPDGRGIDGVSWGYLDDQGVVAIVSPLGRDVRRSTAQAVGTTALARALPQGARDGQAIARALEAADQGISRLGLSTSVAAATAVAVSVEGDTVKTAHVGADRAYRVRGVEVEQLTVDHTIVEETLRRQGKTARDSAPDIDGMPLQVKTALTRVLGSGKGAADVTEHRIAPDEWLVLVSYDVALAVGEVHLREMLKARAPTPQELAEKLVVAAYAGRPGCFAAAAVMGPLQA